MQKQSFELSRKLSLTKRYLLGRSSTKCTRTEACS